MNSNLETEFQRWLFFVDIFLRILTCTIFLVGLFVLEPALEWFFHGDAYDLPTLNQAFSTAVIVVLLSTAVGSYVWMLDKSADRY